MDKDLFNPIQPNFDYFSESTIWKSNPIPYMGESFVIPKFENLSVGSLGTTFNNFKIPDTFNFAESVDIAGLNTIGSAEIDYSKGNTFFTEGIPHWHILDANVNRKDLQDYNLEDFYTTAAVANEAGGNLSRFLSQDNISLSSYTPGDFKENGNILTLTSPFGEIGTVAFKRETNNTVHLPCGHFAAATLTNTSTEESITICGDVLYSRSTNDFGAAVNGIAFHNTADIFTEDSCLGCAFSRLYSFRPSNSTFWADYIKVKSNFSCSHNR